MKHSRLLPFLAWLMLMVFSVGLRAQTAPAPSVNQIYETASRGDIAGANRMIDQVIEQHPHSAKAHYVKAELAARGKDAATARSELDVAEKLAPGLPFVKPEALAALRTQIDGLSTASAAPPQDQRGPDTRTMGAPPSDMAPQQRSSGGGFSLGGLLIPALLAIGLVAFMRRRAHGTPMARTGMNQPGSWPHGGMGGTTFGRSGSTGRWPHDPSMPHAGMHPHHDLRMHAQHGPYSQGPYAGGYPQRGGMGGSIARGIGTGLAIGAGAAVAHEIGQRMFDRNGNEITPGAGESQIARDAGLGGGIGAGVNEDMGGRDFGLQDPAAGWDDAGGGSFGDVGGDDWNS